MRLRIHRAHERAVIRDEEEEEEEEGPPLAGETRSRGDHRAAARSRARSRVDMEMQISASRYSRDSSRLLARNILGKTINAVEVTSNNRANIRYAR